MRIAVILCYIGESRREAKQRSCTFRLAAALAALKAEQTGTAVVEIASAL
jgi:hypothetical protein